MLRLLRHLRPYWLWVLLAPLAMALEVRMDLYQPELMSKIIDDGISAGDTAAILAIGWRMILYAVLGLLGGCACTYCSARAALNFGNDLRTALFCKAQGFSFAETDRFTTGSLVTRIVGDVRTMQTVVVMITRMLIRAPLMLVGSVYLVCTTDARVSLPILAAAPILAALVVSRVRRMRPMFQTIQRRIDDLNAVMQENLTGIRVVKSFTREDAELERFGRANDSLCETGMETGRIMISFGPVISVVQQSAVTAILFMAARDASAKLIQVGQIIAVVNYATQVMMSLIMVSFQLMHVSRAQVAAQRINEVLDTEPSVAEGPDATPPPDASIRFCNVSFAYPGAVGDPVLQDVNLDFPAGGHYAILGSTGSGKTSLLHLIPRFYDATAGAVLVGGRDVREYAFNALRGAIGIVMQDVRLFSGTIAENLRWGASDASQEELERAARIAQAHDFIVALPKGYETDVAQGGVTLSGGQKQRIAIARALVRRPAILLFDDSTSALDTVTERRLLTALRAELRGTTVIRVAQRISSVAGADRITVLDDGRVVGNAPHEELARSCEVYREILDSQAEKSPADGQKAFTNSTTDAARSTPPGGSAATPLSEGGSPQIDAPHNGTSLLSSPVQPPSERGDAPQGQGGVLRAAETPS